MLTRGARYPVKVIDEAALLTNEIAELETRLAHERDELRQWHEWLVDPTTHPDWIPVLHRRIEHLRRGQHEAPARIKILRDALTQIARGARPQSQSQSQ